MEKVAKTEQKSDTEASKIDLMVDLLTNNINTQNETYKKWWTIHKVAEANLEITNHILEATPSYSEFSLYHFRTME